MNVIIEEVEWYPVYVIEDYGVTCDVPGETVAEWIRIEAEFMRVQKEMKQAVAQTRTQDHATEANDPCRGCPCDAYSPHGCVNPCEDLIKANTETDRWER